ncbi:MAG TPA: AraC family transcriptional regulator [Cytophagales bacterium]|nr:AraC family transcriptional regulator [Cytophagales bacterium]
MKAPLQKSPISSDFTFEIKYLKEANFDPNWHFHSEYQIFTVLKGTGTRFIGDYVSPFKAGDLVFTGPDLPHLWRSDPEYFQGDKELWTEGIVIYFQENFLGDEFLQKKEMFKIKQLFIKAKLGIEILGKTSIEARQLMHNLLKMEDFEGILSLLKLLNLLANTSEYNLLSSAGYSNSLKPSDTERMNKVHEYVMKNFREKISLEEAAAIASMTPPAFSRYFKVHANKTFLDFITEIRIGYSCKLLIDKNWNVSQVCHESGFQTLSNFNRQFKAVTHYSPLEYRRKFNETFVGE